MSSDHTTIEMASVFPRVESRTALLPSLTLDIERASRATSRAGSTASDDHLRVVDETNHADLPSSPLLSPRSASREMTASETQAHNAGLPHNDTLIRLSAPLEVEEMDDLDSPAITTPYPGIDDGLLEPGDSDKPHADLPELDEVDTRADRNRHDEDSDHHENGKPPLHDDDDDGSIAIEHELDVVGHNYGDLSKYPTLENRFGEDRPIIIQANGPDVNVYQQKKNLAQGMMDLALLSANANQLRYVIESSNAVMYYWPSIFFISLSIILQIFVGIGLILNSRYDVNHNDNLVKADKVNDFTVIGIFLVTIVNVFITSFSVGPKTVT